MPLVKTEGIVLRTFKLGDTSRIAVLYTRDQGKVKVVAKGARNPKSRLGAGLNLFVHNHVVFSFKETRDLQTLTKCELVREHRALERDPMRLAHAGVAAELVDRVAVGEEHYGELFQLLEGSLRRFDEEPSERMALALAHFELQLTAVLGYLPRFDGCAACGRALGEERRFGLLEGGMLCARCGSGRERTITLSHGAVAVMRLLADGSWDSLRRVRLSRGQVVEVEQTLVAYLRHQATGPRALRSLEFLRAMRRMERGTRRNGDAAGQTAAGARSPGDEVST